MFAAMEAVAAVTSADVLRDEPASTQITSTRHLVLKEKRLDVGFHSSFPCFSFFSWWLKWDGRCFSEKTFHSFIFIVVCFYWTHIPPPLHSRKKSGKKKENLEKHFRDCMCECMCYFERRGWREGWMEILLVLEKFCATSSPPIRPLTKNTFIEQIILLATSTTTTTTTKSRGVQRDVTLSEIMMSWD